jgi:hypothetical protein
LQPEEIFPERAESLQLALQPPGITIAFTAITGATAMSPIVHTRKASRATAFSLALAIAASAACAPAFAANTVRVKRSADPQVTYQRLQAAAAELCGQSPRYEVARRNVWLRCYEVNLQKAVEQMHEPVLMAIHQQHVKDGTTVAG